MHTNSDRGANLNVFNPVVAATIEDFAAPRNRIRFVAFPYYLALPYLRYVFVVAVRIEHCDVKMVALIIQALRLLAQKRGVYDAIAFSIKISLLAHGG